MNERVIRAAVRGDRHKTPETKQYRQLTEAEVRGLHSGAHVLMLDLNGRVATVKINGRVRTWKRDPQRVEIPCKYGMYEYFTLSLEQACDRMLVEA